MLVVRSVASWLLALSNAHARESGRGVLRLGELGAMEWHRGVGAEAEEGALTGALLDGKFILRNR